MSQFLGDAHPSGRSFSGGGMWGLRYDRRLNKQGDSIMTFDLPYPPECWLVDTTERKFDD